MILYRNIPIGYPFLWESSSQPEGRWHAQGEGPVHYFADTPDGAWAEFLRHAEIELDELDKIQRAFWVIEIGIEPKAIHNIPHNILTGGRGTYSACQKAAQQIRSKGITAIIAPSAALRPGRAHGWRMEGGLTPGKARNGYVITVFGQLPQAVAWLIGHCSAPTHLADSYIPLR